MSSSQNCTVAKPCLQNFFPRQALVASRNSALEDCTRSRLRSARGSGRPRRQRRDAFLARRQHRGQTLSRPFKRAPVGSPGTCPKGPWARWRGAHRRARDLDVGGIGLHRRLKAILAPPDQEGRVLAPTPPGRAGAWTPGATRRSPQRHREGGHGDWRVSGCWGRGSAGLPHHAAKRHGRPARADPVKRAPEAATGRSGTAMARRIDPPLSLGAVAGGPQTS